MSGVCDAGGGGWRVWTRMLLANGLIALAASAALILLFALAWLMAGGGAGC